MEDCRKSFKTFLTSNFLLLTSSDRKKILPATKKDRMWLGQRRKEEFTASGEGAAVDILL